MKKIKTLIEYIDEEMSDSKKYIKEAISYKGVDELVCATALKLASVEMEHAIVWHDVVAQEIDKQRKDMLEKGETVPQYMLDQWNEEHEEYIEDMAKLKYELELAKK